MDGRRASLRDEDFLVGTPVRNPDAYEGVVTGFDRDGTPLVLWDGEQTSRRAKARSLQRAGERA